MNHSNTSRRHPHIGRHLAYHTLAPLRIVGRISSRALMGLCLLAAVGMGVLSLFVLTTDRDTVHRVAVLAAPASATSHTPEHVQDATMGGPSPQYPDFAVSAPRAQWPFADTATTTTGALRLDLAGASGWRLDI
ncbi:hypothetical protein ACL02S_22770 [Nocardia sp. 004]|uniref:hypothetical protein n=1 Tax=Nocardia sp. 004 TaxID=3385978 RepID=UPI00399FA281